MKKALITGINGQDGSYLAEFLLDKGYEVFGILKRNSVAETQTTRIEHIRDRIRLHYADITDLSSLVYVIKETRPDELYHLAAQSHVRISFDQPIFTANATGRKTRAKFWSMVCCSVSSFLVIADASFHRIESAAPQNPLRSGQRQA
ncbi:MAG TPA: GDP-mannose 4,6-dehydratase, partial [Pyrinomonadaceae bacterium]|nr:GDP-mannose 4,6-dehydratase [Pyrinomonadaceae bacterium]